MLPLMDELRSSILATLALYDGFGLPLTAMWVYEKLIHPARFAKNSVQPDGWKLSDVREMLDALIEQKKIVHINGFYFLQHSRVSFEDVIEREKIAAQKWKQLVRLGWWLQAVPFVRAVFVSGSMALGNPDTASDFDVVVVTRAGRLYTCRLLLSLVTTLMGARRTRHEHVAPDKFCFNHYLTDDGLALSHHSLYAAAVYNDLISILGGDDVVERFYAANPWLLQYFVRVPIHRAYVRKTVATSPFLSKVRMIEEWCLNGALGGVLEWTLRNWQQRRIFANPATRAPGGRVIANDRQLEFHPHSAEKAILEEYNAFTKQSGAFWNYHEADSGLSRPR